MTIYFLGGEEHSSELPSQWKHLPSLALPDGSHNYDSDTAFFHLPDLENPRKTIFGISCYRQIAAADVKNPTEKITRGFVQKSVCVLSRLPLYGHIQVKMALITEAFFIEADFSRLDLIHQTYDNLNSCLTDDLVRTQQLYVGLSARKLIQTLSHRTLVLFKLFLLERKVLFFQSPVMDLCSYFLTLLSLHPGMLEDGLNESACSVPLDTPPESLSPELFEDRPYSSCSSVKSISNVNLEAAAANENPGEQSLNQRAPSLTLTGAVTNEEVGLPLKVFGRGNLCLPYLSLSYIDTLSQPCIKGYMIGATNILFKQKSGMSEVIVDIEKDKIVSQKAQIVGDLIAAENAYTDVKGKYERTKQLITKYKNEEDKLKQGLEDRKSILEAKQTRFETLKCHAEDKIRQANEVILQIKGDREAEIAKLATMLRKSEIRVESLEQMARQKSDETKELADMCDELIASTQQNGPRLRMTI